MPRPHVVFIHGAFSSGADFEPWVNRFAAAGFTCHAPSLPGHAPPDPKALKVLGISDYVSSIAGFLKHLPEQPILVGHSMGGLVAQHVCAGRSCSALVCVASAPSGMLTAQPVALPHLFPLLPAILAGRPVRPSVAAFRALALNDLPAAEGESIAQKLAFESGRAYREMIFGLSRVRARPGCPTLCVSGAADRIISKRLAGSVARALQAKHIILPARGHWLIAPSAVSDVAEPIVGWLNDVCSALERASAV